MRATEELRKEHGTLRAKLALLERLMSRVHPSPAPIQDVTASLTRCLHRHIEKETLLVAMLQERLHGLAREATRQLLNDHEEQSATLAEIRARLAQQDEQAAGRASDFIEGLRDHMAREEETVFPEIDRALGDPQAREARRLMHAVVRGDPWRIDDANRCAGQLGGNGGAEERRRHPRVRLHIPIRVDGLEDASREAFQEGLTEDLSLTSLFFSLTVPTWRVIRPGEMMRYSLGRWTGRGRVVRVEERSQVDPTQRRVGLALACQGIDESRPFWDDETPMGRCDQGRSWPA